MNLKAQAMLKTFLAHSEHKEELSRFFQTELSEKIGEFLTPQTFNPKTLFSSTAWSHPIHFSWFTQALAAYPLALQPLFLALLTEHQAKGVNEMRSHSMTSLPKKKASPFLRPYLAHILRSELMEPDLLSEQHLPASPLNILLRLERKHLIHLCDLLGIHDLAADLRQVVDRELLGKIYAALTPPQLQFLHYCSKQPMKWIPPKLGLLAWDGSKKQLNKLLHFRGLMRLAKAILQEDASLKWHLMHRLDIGRAKIVQKELYKKQDLSLLPYFKNQVLHIVKRTRLQNGVHDL